MNISNMKNIFILSILIIINIFIFSYYINMTETASEITNMEYLITNNILPVAGIETDIHVNMYSSDVIDEIEEYIIYNNTVEYYIQEIQSINENIKLFVPENIANESLEYLIAQANNIYLCNYGIYTDISQLTMDIPAIKVKDNSLISLLKINIFKKFINDKSNMVCLASTQIDTSKIENIEKFIPEYETYNNEWDGTVLNNTNGRIMGPNGIETYYNLPMDGCIQSMNNLGYYGTIWIRNDGVKMWDEYVMVAADLSIYPKGSLVETSLGTGIVVDTGGFVNNGSGVTFDIAVDW